MMTTGQNALNVGDSIIKGLEEALAYERGERSLRTRTAERTAREARVVAPPLYDSARIRAVRARLALSQPLVAAAHLAVEELERQRVQEPLLERALQRARPVDRVVALRRQELLGPRGQLQRDLALRQPPAQPAQLDLHDLGQLLAAEAVED